MAISASVPLATLVAVDAFIRPSHVRSNVTAADICANETAPGSATTLAFSQSQTSARRPARPRRTLDDLAGVPRYDQAHARSVENNGQIGDPGLRRSFSEACPKSWLRYPNVCKSLNGQRSGPRPISTWPVSRTPPVLREPFPRWNFLLPTISRAWEAACSTPRRTASIV